MYAAWGYDSNGKMNMEITAPAETNCTIAPGFANTYTIDGKSGLFGNTTVAGGENVLLKEDLVQ